MKHQIDIAAIERYMKNKTIQVAVAANARTKENKSIQYCFKGVYSVVNHHLCVFKTKSLEKAVNKYNEL